jgi:hypothetical protein
MKAIRMILTLSLFASKLSATYFSEPTNRPWGYDEELARISHTFSDSSHTLHGDLAEHQLPRSTPGQKTCRALIRFFQVYISPIDGPRSSFYPTSSQYALEAIARYGVLQGIGMGCDRLLRENGEVWVYELTDNYGITRKLDPVH